MRSIYWVSFWLITLEYFLCWRFQHFSAFSEEFRFKHCELNDSIVCHISAHYYGCTLSVTWISSLQDDIYSNKKFHSVSGNFTARFVLSASPSNHIDDQQRNATEMTHAFILSHCVSVFLLFTDSIQMMNKVVRPNGFCNRFLLMGRLRWLEFSAFSSQWKQ